MSKKIPVNRNQVWVFPPTLDECVSERDSVRFVWDFVGALDLGSLGLVEDKSREGRPHYSPEMLLSVWLLGWMDRIHSTRRLERACSRDVGFIWLTGFTRPDHSTISRFFAKNKKLMVRLFKEIVQVAADSGLIGMALHAIDGTKLQAACSSETTLHKTRLEKALKRLDEAVEAGVKEIESENTVDDYDRSLTPRMADPEERKKQIRNSLEKLKQAGTNHLHPTETDARMMKGRQFTGMGYNGQVVADHDSDLIVAQDVVNDQNDLSLAERMVDCARDNLGNVAAASVLDAGYASGEQIDALQKRHLPIFIPFPRDGSCEVGFAKADFSYDSGRDLYVCPMGKELKFQRVEPAGKVELHPRRIYRCSDSQECASKEQCTKAKTGRTVKRTLFDEARERQLELQKEPKTKILVSLRKEIVEHAFGIIKTIQGFSRFTVRGLPGVRAQWALACSAYNLKKLHRMTLAGESLQFC